MTIRSLFVGALVVAGGCGAAPPVAPPPVAPVAAAPPSEPPLGTNAALAPVAWLVGDWRAVDGDLTEHWVAAGGTLYGVTFGRDDTFAVSVIDDGDGAGETADGVRRYLALGDGNDATEYREDEIDADGASFTRGDGDGIVVAFEDGQLVVRRGGAGAVVTLRFARADSATAPALERADLRFAADTAARGIDGWVAAFAPGGMMWRGAPIPHDAIAAAMAPTLAGGRLAWAPVASRARGRVGFTVGTAMFTPTGATAPTWRGSYVTVWVQMPDGTWKVALDTGRREQAAR